MEFKEELSKLDKEIRFAQAPEECQGLPLPGYVGRCYLKRKILFVGKNPGQSGSVIEMDIGLVSTILTGV